MGKKDQRVDHYIAKAEDFAKPVLTHLRELVHKACPGVTETLKWGFPHFEYKGTICSMASFKKHCAFGFWKGSIMQDKYKIMEDTGKTAMGHLGKISGLSDLPDDKILIEYIKEAVKLNEEGIKLPARNGKDQKELDIPDYFMEVISRNKKALETFNNFSYSHKKEYIEWITEAKTEATRNKRLETAIEWMTEGKVRNWKYIKK